MESSLGSAPNKARGSNWHYTVSQIAQAVNIVKSRIIAEKLKPLHLIILIPPLFR